MKYFFEPLISRGVRLAQSMCERAKLAGHPVIAIVVCGGVTGNLWFFEEFRQRQFPDTTVEMCMQVPAYEIVAHGALAYSRSPVVEEHVIAQGLGLSYIGDYTKCGKLLRRGAWHTGIGWILPEGQLPTELPRQLIFAKDIKPRTEDPGDHSIKTDVYATGADSSESCQHISKNDLITWDCEITYPVTKSILSTLTHLGTISGMLPHEEMFPLGTETRESEFELQLTLEACNNLLKAQFSVKLVNGSLCSLKDVHYIPFPLAPRSEFLNRYATSDQTPVTAVTESAGDEPRPNHTQHDPTPSGSSPRAPPGGRGSSTLARTEHATRGIGTRLAPFNVIKRDSMPMLGLPGSPILRRGPFSSASARRHPLQMQEQTRFQRNINIHPSRGRLQHHLYRHVNPQPTTR